MTEGELLRRLAELTTGVRALRASVQELGERTHRSERDITRARWYVRGVAGAAVLGLALTVVGGLLYLGQRDTDRRLTAAVAEQERTRGEVLCPLYGVFLASYRPAAQPAAQRAQYEQAFAVIREGAEALDCPDLPGR